MRKKIVFFIFVIIVFFFKNNIFASLKSLKWHLKNDYLLISKSKVKLPWNWWVEENKDEYIVLSKIPSAFDKQYLFINISSKEVLNQEKYINGCNFIEDNFIVLKNDNKIVYKTTYKCDSDNHRLILIFNFPKKNIVFSAIDVNINKEKSIILLIKSLF